MDFKEQPNVNVFANQKKSGFVKQFELREIFEQNFDEFNNNITNETKQRSKNVEITQSEWNFL